jgi:hypothetical protein
MGGNKRLGWERKLMSQQILDFLKSRAIAWGIVAHGTEI